MNKSDLIENLTEKMSHLSQKDVEAIIQTMFDRMTNTLADGGRIEIRGFGSFEVRAREAREGRNPKTGEKVFVTSRKVPFFKVGKELRERVNTSSSSSSDSISENAPLA